MYKILRMVCAVIAAAAVVACVFLGIYLGMVAVWCAAAAALLFFALCMLFKYLQEEKEGKAEEGALSVAAREKESGSVASAKEDGSVASAKEDGSVASAKEDGKNAAETADDGGSAEGDTPIESGPHGENGAAGGFEKSGAPSGKSGTSGKKAAKNSKK